MAEEKKDEVVKKDEATPTAENKPQPAAPSGPMLLGSSSQYAITLLSLRALKKYITTSQPQRTADELAEYMIANYPEVSGFTAAQIKQSFGFITNMASKKDLLSSVQTLTEGNVKAEYERFKQAKRDAASSTKDKLANQVQTTKASEKEYSKHARGARRAIWGQAGIVLGATAIGGGYIAGCVAGAGGLAALTTVASMGFVGVAAVGGFVLWKFGKWAVTKLWNKCKLSRAKHKECVKGDENQFGSKKHLSKQRELQNSLQNSYYKELAHVEEYERGSSMAENLFKEIKAKAADVFMPAIEVANQDVAANTTQADKNRSNGPVQAGDNVFVTGEPVMEPNAEVNKEQPIEPSTKTDGDAGYTVISARVTHNPTKMEDISLEDYYKFDEIDNALKEGAPVSEKDKEFYIQMKDKLETSAQTYETLENAEPAKVIDIKPLSAGSFEEAVALEEKLDKYGVDGLTEEEKEKYIGVRKYTHQWTGKNQRLSNMPIGTDRTRDASDLTKEEQAKVDKLYNAATKPTEAKQPVAPAPVVKAEQAKAEQSAAPHIYAEPATAQEIVDRVNNSRKSAYERNDMIAENIVQPERPDWLEDKNAVFNGSEWGSYYAKTSNGKFLGVGWQAYKQNVATKQAQQGQKGDTLDKPLSQPQPTVYNPADEIAALKAEENAKEQARVKQSSSRVVAEEDRNILFEAIKTAYQDNCGGIADIREVSKGYMEYLKSLKGDEHNFKRFAPADFTSVKEQLSKGGLLSTTYSKLAKKGLDWSSVAKKYAEFLKSPEGKKWLDANGIDRTKIIFNANSAQSERE